MTVVVHSILTLPIFSARVPGLSLASNRSANIEVCKLNSLAEKKRSVLQTGSCQLVAAKNSQLANNHWPMRKGFYQVGKSEHQLVQAEYGASRVPIVRPLSIQIYTTESPNSNLFWKGGRKWASFYIFEGISWGEIFLEWFKNGKIMFSF